MSSYIVLPHIKIHNANALSSPFTIGFPAMTAWLGFAHALERKIKQSLLSQFEINAVGVISHDFALQTYKGSNDFVHSIVGTANPLTKEGNRSAFIEEPRCHLEISLILDFWADEKELDTLNKKDFLNAIYQLVLSMKLAGGDILSLKQPYQKTIAEDNEHEVRAFLKGLMPGYALIERRDLMLEAMKDGQDAMDAMLDFLSLEHKCERVEKETNDNKEPKEEVVWRSSRKAKGWIVPIATGFQGISPLANAKNQRDETVPHRFAESVVTLGEFKMAHQFNNMNALLWGYHVDIENDLYLCQQPK